MKRLAIPLFLLALLGAFLFWWFSPVQILKRRTESLLSTLTLESGSGVSGRQLGAYALNSLLAAEVKLDTPTIDEANGTFGREELESAFSWLCNQAKQTRFELKDFKSVKIDGDTAVVDFTVEALVELPTYRPADGRYDVTFRWQREEDGWRLTRAKWDIVGRP
jgi:hypothetical protein